MDSIEIEKRYLITEEVAKKLTEGHTPIIMADYYVPNSRNHMDLRIRQKDNEFCITRKQPVAEGDTTVMKETTIKIDAIEFDYLTAGIKTDVCKNRYVVDFNGVKAEIDIFSGRHAPLCVLEIEFPSEQALDEWTKSIVTGNFDVDMSGFKDITNDESYACGKLAEK